MDPREETGFVRTRGESVTTVPGTVVVVLEARAEEWLDDCVWAKVLDIMAPGVAVSVDPVVMIPAVVVVIESPWATGTARTFVAPFETRRQIRRQHHSDPGCDGRGLRAGLPPGALARRISVRSYREQEGVSESIEVRGCRTRLARPRGDGPRRKLTGLKASVCTRKFVASENK